MVSSEQDDRCFLSHILVQVDSKTEATDKWWCMERWTFMGNKHGLPHRKGTPKGVAH